MSAGATGRTLRVYKVTWYEDQDGAQVRWSATQREASSVLAEARRNPNSVEHKAQAHDVPVNKRGLIAWLSRHTPSEDNG